MFPLTDVKRLIFSLLALPTVTFQSFTSAAPLAAITTPEAVVIVVETVETKGSNVMTSGALDPSKAANLTDQPVVKGVVPAPVAPAIGDPKATALKSLVTALRRKFTSVVRNKSTADPVFARKRVMVWGDAGPAAPSRVTSVKTRDVLAVHEVGMAGDL